MFFFIIFNICMIYGCYYIMIKIKEILYFNNVLIKKNFIQNNIYVYSVFYRLIYYRYKCIIFKLFEVVDLQSDNYGIYKYIY